jgi:hypothetical protein
MTRIVMTLSIIGWLFMAAACNGDEAGASADAAPTADAAEALTWTNFGADFFATFCGACHGPGDSLRDYSLLPMVQAEQAKIRCGVSPTSLAGCTIPANQFPIGTGPKPTPEQRMELVRWIDEGARE